MAFKSFRIAVSESNRSRSQTALVDFLGMTLEAIFLQERLNTLDVASPHFAAGSGAASVHGVVLR